MFISINEQQKIFLENSTSQLLFVPIALFQWHRLPTFCHHPRLFSSLAGLIIWQNFSSVRFQNSFLLPNFYQNFLPFSSSPDFRQDAMSGSISSISSSLIRSSRPIRGQYPGYVIILDQWAASTQVTWSLSTNRRGQSPLPGSPHVCSQVSNTLPPILNRRKLSQVCTKLRQTAYSSNEKCI